jgi:hypothetical protein
MVVSVMWLVHIIIFMLCDPPEDPFLNEIFIDLDKAWGALHKLVPSQFQTMSSCICNIKRQLVASDFLD